MVIGPAASAVNARVGVIPTRTGITPGYGHCAWGRPPAARHPIQVVGSERAAENHAFMTSIFESIRLNAIKAKDYVIHLLDAYRSSPPGQRRQLLPSYYVPNQ